MSSKNIVDVELEDGKIEKAYVRKPTRDISTEADMHRAKVWSRCINEGLMTKSQLSSKMEELGVWGEEQEKKQADIMKKVADLEKQLYLSEGQKDVKEGIELVLEMKQARLDLRTLLTERTVLEENSADNIADNAKFDFIAAHCIYDETNTNRLYPTLEDYNKEGDTPLAFAAAARLAELIYGIDSNFEKSLPENKWMEQLGLVDDEGRLVNEDGKLVDLDGKVIDEKGRYLNEDGKVTDADGNLLDDEGNYILKTEYKKEADKKPRRGRAKTATKDS